ncbi:MAG: hypothetical protein IKK77_05670 [Clostridia bacterium]|nr:hypothetical protein [Clostridia bacterium]
MIFNKKTIIVIASIFIVVILSLTVNPYKNFVLTSVDNDLRPTIILDAGHGGLSNTID